MNGLSRYQCTSTKSSVTGLHWSRGEVILLPQWQTRPPQRKRSASSPNVKTSIIKSVVIARIRILSGLLSGIIVSILPKYLLINHGIVSLSSYVCNVLGYIAALVCTSGQLIFIHSVSCFHVVFYLALSDQSQWIVGKMTRLNVCR
jgi:hypothetical protein